MDKGIRHYRLQEGCVYENAGGGFYKCRKVINKDAYEVVNINSGWVCVANVITYYDDGCIEWDSSTMGYFDPAYSLNARVRVRKEVQL